MKLSVRPLLRGMYITLLLFVISFTGCKDFDFESRTNPQTEYDKAFADVFEYIDPEQSWNTCAKRAAEVTINYPGIYTVKIYTADPKNDPAHAFLLGQFDEVEGEQTAVLEFDIPSCLEYVYVSLVDAEGGHTHKYASLNKAGVAKVTFGKLAAVDSRTVNIRGDSRYLSEADTIHFGKKAYWANHPGHEGHGFLTKIPEGDPNNISKEGVYKNFKYRVNGAFSIHPMYHVSSAQPNLYISYKLPGSEQWVKNAQLWTYSSFEWAKYGYHWDDKVGNWVVDPSTIQVQSPGDNTESMISDSAFCYIVGEGVMVNLPAGTELYFSIYVNNRYYYSEQSKNPMDQGDSYLGYEAQQNPHFVTFSTGFKYLEKQDVIFLGAEDSPLPGDFDWNDMVFAIVDRGGMPDIVDMDVPIAKPVEYRIAYEDLGGTGDFDFNDVVISVQHTSGQDNAFVSLLAAGGQLAAGVFFDPTSYDMPEEYTGTKEKTILWEEVHEAFKVNLLYMVNTEPERHNLLTADPKTVALQVGKNFTIRDGAKCFKIVVDGVDKPIGLPDRNGRTPQAILISSSNWDWADEQVSIYSPTYYNGEFKDWVANNLRDAWYDAAWKDLLANENTLIPSDDFNELLFDLDDIKALGDGTIKIDKTILESYQNTGAVIGFVLTGRSTHTGENDENGETLSISLYQGDVEEGEESVKSITYCNSETNNADATITQTTNNGEVVRMVLTPELIETILADESSDYLTVDLQSDYAESVAAFNSIWLKAGTDKEPVIVEGITPEGYDTPINATLVSSNGNTHSYTITASPSFIQAYPNGCKIAVVIENAGIGADITLLKNGYHQITTTQIADGALYCELEVSPSDIRDLASVFNINVKGFYESDVTLESVWIKPVEVSYEVPEGYVPVTCELTKDENGDLYYTLSNLECEFGASFVFYFSDPNIGQVMLNYDYDGQWMNVDAESRVFSIDYSSYMAGYKIMDKGGTLEVMFRKIVASVDTKVVGAYYKPAPYVEHNPGDMKEEVPTSDSGLYGTDCGLDVSTWSNSTLYDYQTYGAVLSLVISRVKEASTINFVNNNWQDYGATILALSSRNITEPCCIRITLTPEEVKKVIEGGGLRVSKNYRNYPWIHTAYTRPDKAEVVEVYYPLTQNTAATVTGSSYCSAIPEEICNLLEVQDYASINKAAEWPAESGYDASHKTQRIRASASSYDGTNYWPLEDDINWQRYVQFGMEAAAGAQVTVSEISLYAASAGSNALRWKVYYDTDPNFTNPTLMADYSAKDAVVKNIAYYMTASPGVVLAPGEKIYLRVYPKTNGAQSSNRAFSLADVRISGVAVSVQ